MVHKKQDAGEVAELTLEEVQQAVAEAKAVVEASIDKLGAIGKMIFRDFARAEYGETWNEQPDEETLDRMLAQRIREQYLRYRLGPDWIAMFIAAEAPKQLELPFMDAVEGKGTVQNRVRELLLKVDDAALALEQRSADDD